MADAVVAQPVPMDLGTLGGTYSFPSSVNDSGQVVGESTTAAGDRHAFLWTAASGMIDLGTVGGRESGAFAISETGQIVGWSDAPGVPPPGGAHDHAFSWTAAGGMVDLGTLGGTDSQATHVNNRGQVFGWSLTGVATEGRHAFVWTPSDGMVDLGTLGGPRSEVWGANDRGQAVGDSLIQGERSTLKHMFLWSATTGMVDLGAFLGESHARGINESGQVIGLRCTGGTTVPFRCDPFSWTAAGGVLDLGRLGSDPRGTTGAAYDLNDAGQIVGWSETDEPIVGDEFGRRVVHATLWTAKEGLVLDLGTLGGVYSEALRVNEHGEVVGRSLIAKRLEDEWHAFMWTPTQGMVELDALSGRDYSQALGINNSGQVIGVSHNNRDPGVDGRATMWQLPASGDVSPPTLLLPATIVVDGASPAGATVTYSVSATDDVDLNPVVVCSPPSASVFPLLASTVSCTATDAAGNSASGTFQVIVRDAHQQLAEAISLILSWNLTRLGTSLPDKLQIASGFTAGGSARQACEIINSFLNQVRAQAGKALTVDQATELSMRGIRIQNVIGC